VSRAKIAPNLSRWVSPDVLMAKDNELRLAAARELRALLAVARAARDYRDGHSCSEDECPIATALDRALSRLSRASAAKGGKP
jgi:uncharacterized protein